MQPFEPHSLPLHNISLESLIGLVGEANRALAKYDGLLAGLINPAVLLSPLTTKEAERSSRIEGTRAELGDVYQYEAGISLELSIEQDSQEILNYRETLGAAHQFLLERPMGLPLIKSMHQVLLNSVRGQDKRPGEFRIVQNWIGPKGCPMEEATYVPPSPLRLLDHLENWAAYLHFKDVDPVIQTAIVHAQFEIIHPFLDGNGRLGRLMIPLFLFKSGVLEHPMFYLSEYLEAHRDEYYSRLGAITRDNDWAGWIHFFLQAVIEQARHNAAKAAAINSLYESMKDRVQAATHSQYTFTLLDAIFDKPVFTSSALLEKTGIQRNTLMTLLRQLKDAGILRTLQEGGGRRPATMVFPEIINIVEGRNIF
jgi:Fic family protein